MTFIGVGIFFHASSAKKNIYDEGKFFDFIAHTNDHKIVIPIKHWWALNSNDDEMTLYTVTKCMHAHTNRERRKKKKIKKN